MDNILTHVKAVLRTTPQRFHQLTQSFPDELLRRQPLPGEWSALECLLHLIDIDSGVFPFRVKALLAGEDFPAFFPDEQGTQLTAGVIAADLASKFDAIRANNLQLIDMINPDDLSKTANHAELGLVSLSELLHEWGGHDLMHTVQAEQALMQPFIQGCGAWESYFTAHIARASAG